MPDYLSETLGRQLPAIQLGASLADRARNYQLQVAHLALQQEQQSLASQQAALALQTQGYALQHRKDQDAKLARDLPKVQDWHQRYLAWNANGDPTAPFPEPPSDLESLDAIKSVGDMTGPVLQSLPMAQNRYFTQQAVHQTLGQINDDVKFAIEHGMGEIVRQNNSGLDDNLRPDKKRWAAIQAAIAPERKKQQELKDLSTMSQIGVRIYIDELNDQFDRGEISEERYNQLRPYARTKGGVKQQNVEFQVEGLKESGIVSTPEQENDAKNYIRSTGGKLPSRVSKTFESANSSFPQLNDAMARVQEFNAKYGPKAFDEYIGPIDNPTFSLKGKFKGLTTEEQTQAKEILSQIKTVLADYRNGIYGASLTGTEKAEFKEAAGSAERADYLVAINGFNKALSNQLRHIVEDHKYTGDIQLDVKKRYAPNLFKNAPSTSQPSAGSAPSGVSNLPSGWSFTK